MTKENILFVVIGILAGFIGGFFFANSINQGASLTAATPGTAASAALPSGHPAVPGTGGSIPEVQAAIDKAKANPNDFDAQMKAAELYYQIQRFDGAIEFLKKASELQPENQDVLVNLGNANFDAGRYEEAEKVYTQVLAKKPEDADIRADLALSFVFRDKPDYDRAIKEFNTVLETNPTHVLALQNLTVAYTKKSDSAAANATLAKLEQVDSANTSIAKLREEIQKIETK
jgi:tetratricopeptide (TPR) repeat protein